MNYGLLLMDMSRFGAARHRFLDAVEADPSQSEARIYAASACFECGDIVRAEQLLPPPANGRRWMQKRGTTWAWR